MRVAVHAEQLLQPAPGGTGRYTAALLALLPAEQDCEVVPFVARHRAEDVRAAWASFGLDAAGVPAPVVLALPRPVLYEAWHRLGAPHPAWASSRIAGCDLVHAPSPAVPPRGRRPLVVTVHDAAFEVHPETYPARGLRFHRSGVAAAARRADLVVTVSETAAREVAERTPVPPGRIRVVPNGVDHTVAGPDEVAEVTARHGLDDRPYLLWVGTTEPRKNVGTLVAAVARLADRRGGAPRLVLVGPAGWLDRGLVADADRATLGDRLRLLGRVPERDLRALYAGAALFCFPSRHEGFGLPVLEAMVQGTPVVCADVPALREVTGGAARLVPATDVAAWAGVIADLLGRPEEAAALAAAGTTRAAGFSWSRTVAATRDVYAEVLART